MDTIDFSPDIQRDEALAEFEKALDQGAALDKQVWLKRVPAPLDAQLAADLDDLERLRQIAAPLRSFIAEVRQDAQAQLDASASAFPNIPNFEIRQEIGRGGMGVVYMGFDLNVRRLVAIKVLLGAKLTQQQRERFNQEAQLLGALTHPNIVQVFAHDGNAEPPYLVLTFVDGLALSQKITPENPWPWQQVVGLMTKVIEAVDYYHDKGIIHRDLKPHNILLQSDGAPMVADFGLAKLIHNASIDITQLQTHETPQGIGTPYYMAPEQYGSDSAQLGPSTDIYALGAIMYELLTGRPPFYRPEITYKELDLAKKSGPPSFPDHGPAIPAHLQSVLQRCLQPIPIDRFPSAKELLIELQSVKNAGATAPVIAKPHTRYRWSIAVVALLLVLAGSGLWFWRDELFRWPNPDSGSDARLSDRALQKTPPFVTQALLLDQIQTDMQTAHSPKKRRYVTLAHLKNDASIDAKTRKQWLDALQSVGKYLGKGKSVLEPVDEEQSLLAIDWADRNWPLWDDIIAGDPYALTFAQHPNADLAEAERKIQQAANSRRPYVRADWFLRRLVQMSKETPPWIAHLGPLPPPASEAVTAWDKRPLRLTSAAADLGLPDANLLSGEIERNALLADKMGMRALMNDGTITRSQWESQEAIVSPFQEAARCLGRGIPAIDK